MSNKEPALERFYAILETHWTLPDPEPYPLAEESAAAPDKAPESPAQEELEDDQLALRLTATLHAPPAKKDDGLDAPMASGPPPSTSEELKHVAYPHLLFVPPSPPSTLHPATPPVQTDVVSHTKKDLVEARIHALRPVSDSNSCGSGGRVNLNLPEAGAGFEAGLLKRGKWKLQQLVCNVPARK